MENKGGMMKVYCINCGWKRKITHPILVKMLPIECPECGSDDVEIKEG